MESGITINRNAQVCSKSDLRQIGTARWEDLSGRIDTQLPADMSKFVRVGEATVRHHPPQFG
jgi:hypothetical protein